MTDFEKKTSATENTTGICHLTRNSVLQWALKLKTALVMAESCHLKGHMLKVKHTMPVYMARTKLLYFDSNTGALSRETIRRHEIQPTLVISK